MNKGMSSSSPQRVREAAKQLEKNCDPTTEGAGADLVLDWDCAFAMKGTDGGALMYIGRLPQIKRSAGIHALGSSLPMPLTTPQTNE